MKHGVNPTRKQKELLKKKGLNSLNWLVSKNCPTEIVFIHRLSGKTRTLNLNSE